MEVSEYRPSKVVEWTIRDTSTVLFDDELYHQAIHFLSSILHASGGNDSLGIAAHTVCAQVPYPEQLALLSTIVVHPRFTNRCSSAERSTASDLALRLLRDITSIAGPVAADFRTAFAFTYKSTRRDGRRRLPDTDSSDGDAERQLETKYAREESVWAQVEDFWHIVGWALNCSVRELKRWERWKLWLEWMLDALDADWVERIRQAERIMMEDETAAKKLLLESMIFEYLEHLEGRNGRRRVRRAILATGDQKSSNEFPEVWKNETKERKRKAVDFASGPRKKLNLEQDEFGDYGIDEDEDELDPDDVQHGSVTPTPADGDDGDDITGISSSADAFEAGTAALGGIDALNVRHRVMAMLYRVALDLPNDFTHIEDLFDLYTESIRPLPLSQFSVLASNPYLHPQARLSLLVNHLLPLQSANVRLKGGDILKVDQERLTRDFLPKAGNASTMTDNAKISLALEASLMTLMEDPGIRGSDGFSAALEEGIRARKKRAVADGRKKGKGMVGDEKDAKVELEHSSQRLLALLEATESSAGTTRDRTHIGKDDMTTSSLTELSSTSDDDSQ